MVGGIRSSIPGTTACRLGLMLLVSLSAGALFAQASPLPLVNANDNRAAAGHLDGTILELRLELRRGRWYPEDETGPHRDVYAFAEAGHPLQSPGPLLRVLQGTTVHATVRNMLPLAAKVFGLHRHPGDPKEALTLQPGESREAQFVAGEPGTYLYWATTSDKPLDLRDEAETLLSGAFIVDAPHANRDDRIFVIGIWTKGRRGITTDEEVLSINGKSWPYTERMSYTVGDTTHWRILNPTWSDHALHLHGFYFKVDGVGDGDSYERYSEALRRTAVTEHIEPGHVFELSWSPERAGNWLFHCHMVSHMSPTEPSGEPESKPASGSAHEHSLGMSGLVIGITVRPGPGSPPVPSVATATHKLQLVVSESPSKIPLYHLEVVDPLRPAPPEKDKRPTLLGPPIFITRGETTEIEVKNQSSRPTTIHWHGIELESYYDGVSGWTGSDKRISPPVAPGTSFIARMTPPRAGTFIYHTHWHDNVQLVNALYGPLVVLKEGEQYDPEHDRIFVFSAGKYAPFGFMLLVNGHPEPDPVALHTSTRYRLRLINITENEADLRVRLMTKGVPVQWKVIAKDGADLPPAQLKYSAADMAITVGETYDVEYQTEMEGVVDLEIRETGFPTPVTLPLTFSMAK